MGKIKDTKPSAAARISSFLVDNPAAAFTIAYAAIEGLYINEDDCESILSGDACFPRGDGSEYVDHVGIALTHAGIDPLIDELQAEWEEEEL